MQYTLRMMGLPTGLSAAPLLPQSLPGLVGIRTVRAGLGGYVPVIRWSDAERNEWQKRDERGRRLVLRILDPPRMLDRLVEPTWFRLRALGLHLPPKGAREVPSDHGKSRSTDRSSSFSPRRRTKTDS
jgi:hypothetical protein